MRQSKCPAIALEGDAAGRVERVRTVLGEGQCSLSLSNRQAMCFASGARGCGTAPFSGPTGRTGGFPIPISPPKTPFPDFDAEPPHQGADKSVEAWRRSPVGGRRLDIDA